MTFAEIMDKKQALMERSKSAKTIEELKKIKEDMAALNDELTKLNQEQEMERMRSEIADSMSRGEYKGKPLGGVDVPNTKVDKKDFAATPEYRKAFMEFFRTGEMPAMFRGVAMTSNNSAVIPVPILNEIVQKMEKYGNVLPLVRHLSYPADFYPERICNLDDRRQQGRCEWQDHCSPDLRRLPAGCCCGHQLPGPGEEHGHF